MLTFSIAGWRAFELFGRVCSVGAMVAAYGSTAFLWVFGWWLLAVLCRYQVSLRGVPDPSLSDKLNVLLRTPCFFIGFVTSSPHPSLQLRCDRPSLEPRVMHTPQQPTCPAPPVPRVIRPP